MLFEFALKRFDALDYKVYYTTLYYTSLHYTIL
jgi:hypothetical protein